MKVDKYIIFPPVGTTVKPHLISDWETRILYVKTTKILNEIQNDAFSYKKTCKLQNLCDRHVITNKIKYKCSKKNACILSRCITSWIIQNRFVCWTCLTCVFLLKVSDFHFVIIFVTLNKEVQQILQFTIGSLQLAHKALFNRQC
jgi:hypothetical protein